MKHFQSNWIGIGLDRGYKEDFVREQIVRASSLDRERLFNQEGRCIDKRRIRFH